MADKNIQIAAIQEQARDWWRLERPKFDLVTSQLTLDEAGDGAQLQRQTDSKC